MAQFFSSFTRVILFILFPVCSIAQSQVAGQTEDEFPEKAIWLNIDHKLVMDNLREKIAIVVVSDERCTECGYYLRMLESMTVKLPATQLLEVMVADTTNPLSRKHLVNYIQRNGYMHPITVFPDLKGFKNLNVQSAPYFILYEKGVRTITQGGHEGYVAVAKRVDELNEQGEVFKTCLNHQFRSHIEPGSFANPVVETPTYIAFEEGGEHIYLNDAAHNRLLEFDASGTITHLIGTTLPGYFDQNVFTSQFNRPHGMVHANGNLYIADTYNNRIRVIDMTSEQVSSLVGSGYITWKKVKAIDARFEPLGLPTDVAVLGNMLYVLSASTNQLFEVDMKDGAARLVCDFPDDFNGLLRNCPVNMNAGSSVLYVTMADGKVFKVDRKGKISEIKKGTPFRFVSVCEWKNGIAGITRDGRVVYLEENKEWKVVGEQEAEGKVKNEIRLAGATDAMVKDGDLYVVDSDNHLVRMIGSPSDKLMKNFWFRPNQELVGFDAAHTNGDIMLLDSLYLGSNPVELHVLLDLEGYKIVPAGQNELLPMDVSGKMKVDSETIRKEEFTITVQPDYTEPDIYLEVYLTLEHPENRGLFLIKRAYLDIPIAKQQGAETLQEQIVKPNLLPY
jgi:DNA-binding beta-propeller fold protein YncE